MTTKMFEVRDDGTLIVVLATQLRPGSDHERRLLARAGFGSKADDQAKYVFLARLSGGEQAGTYNTYDWQTVHKSRTLFEAHRHIEKHFNYLENGQVIDVEYILGIRKEPKVSEVVEA